MARSRRDDLDPYDPYGTLLPEPEPLPADPLDRIALPDTGEPHPIYQTGDREQPTPNLPPAPEPQAPVPAPPPPVPGLADRAGAGAPAAAGNYQPVSGWEISKLNDLSHQSPKYVFMRGVQDLGLPAIGIGDGAGDRGAMSQSLGSLVSYVQAHGYPNAHQAGDDSIDFGDGYGPIDVLTAQGQWWWGSGGGGGAAAPAGAGAGTGDSSGVLAQILAQLTGGGTGGGTAAQGSFGLSAADQAFRNQILASLQQIISESGQPIGDVSQSPEAQAQFEATLTHNLLTERKDRLERALSLGAGFISSEQQFQLQSQLQATNAALAQNAQRLQLLSSLLQNQQYYDNLSFLYDQLVANQNTQATPQ